MPGELRRSLKQKKNNVKATSCRVQSVQGASYRPVLLKEGYLHKPAFFRFVSSNYIVTFCARIDRLMIIFHVCIIYFMIMHHFFCREASVRDTAF